MLTSIHWKEPYPGLDENGVSATAHVELRCSIEDAIKIQRAHLHGKGVSTSQMANGCLLDDFVALHWAQIVRVEVGDSTPTISIGRADADCGILTRGRVT